MVLGSGRQRDWVASGIEQGCGRQRAREGEAASLVSVEVGLAAVLPGVLEQSVPVLALLCIGDQTLDVGVN